VMNLRPFALACASAIVAMSGASRALAETNDEPSSSARLPPENAPRPWLYLDDPTVPDPLRAVAFSRATYTKDASPTRPFGANLARPGGVVEVGGEVGLLPKLSIAASVFGGGDQIGLGGLAGLRFEPFQKVWRSTHAVVSGGWLHEQNGGDGGWLRVAVAQDIQRWRLGATVHGEHVFAQGRDPVDVMVMAGVSYAVAGPLRLGVEYVGQDLEESFVDQAEQGFRQFVGPQVALELLEKRLSVALGPAVGIGSQSPPFSGRLALAYEY
jgi:hypothetical protein